MKGEEIGLNLASLAEQRLLEMRGNINGDLRGLSDELAATNKLQAKHGQRLDNLETRQVVVGRARVSLLGLEKQMMKKRVVNRKLEKRRRGKETDLIDVDVYFDLRRCHLFHVHSSP